MENYQPAPPADVWAHLEQNLVQAPMGSTQSHLGNAGKIVNAIKSAGIITKIALLAVVPSLLGVYLMFQSEPATKMATVSPANQVLEDVKSNEPEENNQVLAEPKRVESSDISNSASAVAQESNSGKSKPNNNPILPVIENKSNTPNPETNAGQQNSVNTGSGIAARLSNPAKKETPAKRLDDIDTIPVPKMKNLQKSESSTLEIINVFTPNGDGINDKFDIEIENPVYYHLIIYDFKGKVVFESSDKSNTWNGTDMKTGMDCEVGYYTYSFDYQLNNSKPVQNKIDWLLLNR